MKFECPSCKKPGQVDDSKVPEVGVSATCPQCNSKFLIKREVPKDFVFEAVEQTTVETKQKKPMGKLAMFFIAFGITIVVNLAVHIPFIAINGFKMHMGPLSMVNTIAMIAAYFCLLKKRLHALTIVSAVIGIILIVALDIPSSGSRSPAITPLLSTTPTSTPAPKPSYNSKGWTQESTGSTEVGPWLDYSPPGTRYCRYADRTIQRLYPPGVMPNAPEANPFCLGDSSESVPQ